MFQLKRRPLGRRTRLTNKQLRFENLEPRQLLSAISLNNAGLLKVNGTRYGDTIDVAMSQDNHDVIVTMNHTTVSFEANRVVKGDIRGNNGNEVIRIAPSVNIPFLVLGGNGNDRIEGGSGPDDLRGGAGNDNISGGAGDDRIVGDGGRDTLRGGLGRDQINGGCNREDYIFANLRLDRFGQTWDTVARENNWRIHDIIDVDCTDTWPDDHHDDDDGGPITLPFADRQYDPQGQWWLLRGTTVSLQLSSQQNDPLGRVKYVPVINGQQLGDHALNSHIRIEVPSPGACNIPLDVRAAIEAQGRTIDIVIVTG